MDILTKPLSSFTFTSIQEFAQEGKPEGIQLDYKKDFQVDEKTSQLVSAFANTRGGVILIGITEDRTTGIPTNWDGIPNGRHDEHVAQVIAGISPIPHYEVHTTDEQNGKVFVLIRVFEGDETPYYPHNDSNLWVRTGNIKKSVEIASPEHAELLYKKAERAGLGRMHNRDRADRNFGTFLQNAEKKRLRDIENEKADYMLKKSRGDEMPEFVSRIDKYPVGYDSGILKIILQPYFPHEEFVKPRDTEPIIRDSHVNNMVYDFPVRQLWHSIPEGMLYFDWQTGVICQQVFSNGLIFSAHDIKRQTQTGPAATHIGWFTGELFVVLKGSKNILERMGYQGSVIGQMTVTGLLGANVNPIVRSMFPGENSSSAFDNYSWDIETDTNILADEEKIREYVADITKDIHWSFDHKDIVPRITKEYLVTEKYI